MLPTADSFFQNWPFLVRVKPGRKGLTAAMPLRASYYKYYKKAKRQKRAKQVRRGAFYFAASTDLSYAITEAFSVNSLRSLRAFAGCFLELNDVYWELRSTNVFLKVSRYFSDESEFIVASLSLLRGQSFLS